MAFLTHDCPRCDARKINFIAQGAHLFASFKDLHNYRIVHNHYEILAACSDCNRTSIFKFNQTSDSPHQLHQFNWNSNPFLNLKDVADLKGVLSPADLKISPPPQHLPADIETAYNEGSKCLSIGCYNAAATMYRLCLDFSTKQLLPDDAGEINSKIRRSLGLRMKWLFDNSVLPESLKELAECVKDDGNDGAHEGLINEIEALDLKDFTYILLDRIYTEKQRIIEAKNRRMERHK